MVYSKQGLGEYLEITNIFMDGQKNLIINIFFIVDHENVVHIHE